MAISDLPQPTDSIPLSGSVAGLAVSAEALLASLPWGVVLVDAQGLVQQLNQQAARWGGAAPEALLGRPFAELGLPAELAAALLPATGPDAAAQEVWLPSAGQWVCFTATPQLAGGQQH